MMRTLTIAEKELYNEIATYQQGIEYNKREIKSLKQSIKQKEIWIDECTSALSKLLK